MAGEELEKDQNYAARERIAADPEKSAAKLAKVSDQYDLEGYSDKDVVMAFRGGTFDDSDYQRLTGNIPVNKPEGGIEPEVDGDPVVPEVAPITAGPIEINTGAGDVSMPGNSEVGFGNMGSQTVVQDNDQVSSVVGNDNTVNQDQDNSVHNFGGRTFDPTDWKKSWMNNKFSA